MISAEEAKARTDYAADVRRRRSQIEEVLDERIKNAADSGEYETTYLMGLSEQAEVDLVTEILEEEGYSHVVLPHGEIKFDWR